MRSPYVGPQPLSAADTIYGRDREVRELYYMLTAERIVLLHSPSGAGKSSLIAARGGVLDRMREDFTVWPVVRLNQIPPAGAGTVNRYVWSTLKALQPDRADAPTLADAVRPPSNQAVLVIFDQFEEVLTLDPIDVEAKREFFRQLGNLLAEPNVWALLVLREDYLAPLDPYRRLLPTHLRNRYRLDLLGTKMAREAIVLPAAEAGRTFADQAIDKLISDLSEIRVQQPDGTFKAEQGPYVEPLQLQVACERLWEQLPIEETLIRLEHIGRFGEVTVALADYYARAVSRVAQEGVEERDIREWFERSLLNSAGIRRQVLEGPGASEGLPNDVVRALEKAHLIRRERRNEAVWYELAHDRLIAPVQLDNKAWFNKNLTPLQWQADTWDRTGRSPTLLASRKQLKKWRSLGSKPTRAVEVAFLKASEDNARAEHLRMAAPFAAVALLVLSVAALYLLHWARQQSAIAMSRQLAMTAKDHAAVDPMLAVMVALTAIERQRTEEAAEALQEAVQATEKQKFRGHEEGASVVIFSPEPASRLFSGGSDGNVILWNVDRGAEIRTVVTRGPGIIDASFDGAGRELALATVEGLKIIDTNTGAERTMPTGCRPLASVAITPDGRRIAIACWENGVVVFDGLNEHWRIPLASVMAVAFAPDNKTLAAAGADKKIRIFDVEKRQERASEGAHRDVVRDVAFSPDGKSLASVGDDGALVVWGVEPLRRRYVADAHAGGVCCVAISSDGQYVATGGTRDAVARVWDLAKGTPKLSLWGHEGKILSVAFAPSGKRLVTAADDRRIRLFDLDTDKLLGKAREIVRASGRKLTPAECEQYLRQRTCPAW